MLFSIPNPQARTTPNMPKMAALQHVIAPLRLGRQPRFPFLVVVQIQNFLHTERLLQEIKAQAE